MLHHLRDGVTVPDKLADILAFDAAGPVPLGGARGVSRAGGRGFGLPFRLPLLLCLAFACFLQDIFCCAVAQCVLNPLRIGVCLVVGLRCVVGVAKPYRDRVLCYIGRYAIEGPVTAISPNAL